MTTIRINEEDVKTEIVDDHHTFQYVLDKNDISSIIGFYAPDESKKTYNLVCLDAYFEGDIIYMYKDGHCPAIAKQSENEMVHTQISGWNITFWDYTLNQAINNHHRTLKEHGELFATHVLSFIKELPQTI